MPKLHSERVWTSKTQNCHGWQWFQTDSLFILFYEKILLLPWFPNYHLEKKRLILYSRTYITIHIIFQKCRQARQNKE
ncbi:hypothetical protein TPHV1_30016 [Treponema phagedenis]|uniref:Uncharacterized protein n=1 Tax=Treponema phagedenis TaxID=162 RepID=A0A0B7GZM1_TREPH|nr:hypothetical protein TPHV1_30016 [Treponema phagedenis]